ncbi:helix-turn-helix transcriptional regulator [Pseudomonas fragi]|uniref:helix-turn-helix transcriptional regulator n=1 Tax=Pseudomonas fragi TaxID=296 RepID=UPI00359CA431
MLSKKQVCDMLGVAQVTVWRWVRDGHLPKPLQLGPRRIAWRTSDLQAFLTRQEG